MSVNTALNDSKKLPSASQLITTCYELLFYIINCEDNEKTYIRNIKSYTEKIVNGYAFLAPEDKTFNEKMLFHLNSESWEYCTNHMDVYMTKILNKS